MIRMKRKFKRIIGAIALVLVAVSLCAVLGNLSGGFQKPFSEWQLREVNEDNLYQSFEFADEDGVFANGKDGVTAKLDANNVLHVTGVADDDLEIIIGTCVLEEGTSYVFDSSYSKGSKASVYMTLVDGDGDEIAKSYQGADVISGDTITSDTHVQLVLKIAKGTDLNIKFKPVLCEGTVAADLVSFYK